MPLDPPFNPSDHPHRRLNMLTGEWVLVSPQRTKRPWQGRQDPPSRETRPLHDPQCYLCPGNRRAGEAVNPNYESTFVFENDFSALLAEPTGAPPETHPLLRIQGVAGVCRVLCFSPRHDLTLAAMTRPELRAVVELWVSQHEELSRRWRWVQIFENKGALMGCSNPHPHGQIWASNSLPNEPAKEDARQRAYYEKEGRPLLLDYAALEIERGERLVARNEDWVVLVPFWAVWPFETLLLPARRHVTRLADLTPAERDSLAQILSAFLPRYDNLFATSFPYSMGWHGAPSDDSDPLPWQLHAHFYPPLLRSASIKKFLVGYELLAEAQRDLTAEQAAARLRELPELHYTKR